MTRKKVMTLKEVKNGEKSSGCNEKGGQTRKTR